MHCSVWRFTGDDVLLHALPIFHVHGLFVASHGALLNGSIEGGRAEAQHIGRALVAQCVELPAGHPRLALTPLG